MTSVALFSPLVIRNATLKQEMSRDAREREGKLKITNCMLGDSPPPLLGPTPSLCAKASKREGAIGV